jgi:hypothetical protein
MPSERGVWTRDDHDVAVQDLETHIYLWLGRGLKWGSSIISTRNARACDTTASTR